MDIRNDEKVIEFFLKREIKPQTEEAYIRVLGYYIKHAGDGLTPTELIREAKEDYWDIRDEDERRINKRFLRFKKWLKSEDQITSESKKTYISHIRTFYTTLNIKEVPSTTFKVGRKKQLKKNDLPSRVEVKTAVLEGRKYQSIILLAASSGLYGGDIRSLKLNQFLESFNQQAHTNYNNLSHIDEMVKIADENEIIIKWEGTRYKNSIEYMTFSTGETTRAILQYLRKHPQNSIDDYLYHHNGKQLNESTFKVFQSQLNKRLEIKSKYKRINFLNLRKRFGSIIEPKVSFRQGQYMLGHVLPPVHGSYFKLPGEDEMREAYLKVLPDLMILEDVETRVLTTEDKAKMDNLEKTVLDLQGQLKGVLSELNRRDRELPPPK